MRYLESDLIDPRLAAEPMDRDTLALYQKMFNITAEERDEIIRVLAENESEAVGSMGDDTPMPVLSPKVRPLYDYFRQEFAQVTNPPIDPLRESIVMSLQTQIGPECNIFVPAPEHATQIVMNSPVLSQRKLRQILALTDFGVTHEFIDLQYEPDEGLHAGAAAHLRRRPRPRCATAARAAAVATATWYRGKLPVHALLATGAVHHHLVEKGLRCECNLLVETGTARDPHHFACLIGYGATAVYPYLAYQTLYDMMRKGRVKMDVHTRLELGRSYRARHPQGPAQDHVEDGHLHHRQLSRRAAVRDRRPGRRSRGPVLRRHAEPHPGRRISTICEADAEQLARARLECSVQPWTQGGLLKYMHGGEYHMYNPDVIATLQRAVMHRRLRAATSSTRGW